MSEKKKCDLSVCNSDKLAVAVSEFGDSIETKNYCSLSHAALGTLHIWFDRVRSKAGAVSQQTFHTAWSLLLGLANTVEKEWKTAGDKVAEKKST